MGKSLGIIGYPLGHSISPVFQQAGLDAAGIDATYEGWETAPEDLARRLASFRSDGFVGSSVTIPHKESVMALLDEVSEGARLIGSVNTIVSREGKLIGYNTDAPGFLRGLRENGGFEAEGKDTVLVGTGGAGRAVAFGLAGEGVASLMLVNRTVARAERLGQEVSRAYPDVRVSVEGEIPEGFEYHLLVNGTSVGMKHTAMEEASPVSRDRLVPGALVYDLIYNPEKTVLLKQAKEAGSQTLGGLPMLVYQGAAAFEIWTGVTAPVRVMFAAAEGALSARQQPGL